MAVLFKKCVTCTSDNGCIHAPTTHFCLYIKQDTLDSLEKEIQIYCLLSFINNIYGSLEHLIMTEAMIKLDNVFVVPCFAVENYKEH